MFGLLPAIWQTFIPLVLANSLQHLRLLSGIRFLANMRGLLIWLKDSVHEVWYSANLFHPLGSKTHYSVSILFVCFFFVSSLSSWCSLSNPLGFHDSPGISDLLPRMPPYLSFIHNFLFVIHLRYRYPMDTRSHPPPLARHCFLLIFRVYSLFCKHSPTFPPCLSPYWIISACVLNMHKVNASRKLDWRFSGTQEGCHKHT